MTMQVPAQARKSFQSPKTLVFDQVPDYWKLANVTFIHKKALKEDLGNSRPVSLTRMPDKASDASNVFNDAIRLSLKPPKALEMSCATLHSETQLFHHM
ncbi:hypothetical protein DUI87_11225 [Hirundo rustica rustica]|uniref:Uncharacterized protein n=1 Tax=Hirundo rustica rustica TaxID=333673 RepID=A0A3M0KMA1_HIRRU|nr:hypothetical protein DUI87_11225 [Hirundo rustica rustica]